MKEKIIFAMLLGSLLTIIGQDFYEKYKRNHCIDLLIERLDDKRYIENMNILFQMTPNWQQAYVFHSFNVNRCILGEDNELERRN